MALRFATLLSQRVLPTLHCAHARCDAAHETEAKQRFCESLPERSRVLNVAQFSAEPLTRVAPTQRCDMRTQAGPAADEWCRRQYVRRSIAYTVNSTRCPRNPV